jgi:hypothetical protein
MQPNTAWGQMHPQMFNQGFAMQLLLVFGTHYQQQPLTGSNLQLANKSGLNQQLPSGLNQAHSNLTGVNQPQATGFNHQHTTPTSLNQLNSEPSWFSSSATTPSSTPLWRH